MARELTVKKLVLKRIESDNTVHAHFEYEVSDGDLRKSAMANVIDIDTTKTIDDTLSDFEDGKRVEESTPRPR